MNGRRAGCWLLLALLLVGCRLGKPADPLARYGVQRESALFLTGGQPRTLDPALTIGGPAGPIGHIFSGLVQLDNELAVAPDLAAGWERSDDGLVYTFYLHRGAVFHDGRSVTAADVRDSWERALDPATGSDTALTYLGDIVGAAERAAGSAATVAGITAVDDHTLRVALVAPRPTFLARLTFPVAFVVDIHQVDDKDWAREPNGSGPFTLVAWEDDSLLLLARNELYYGPAPALAHVVYDLGPSLSMTLYETDQIDIVGIGGGDLARMQDPNNPLAAELRTGIALCTSTIGFNHREPPFDDARVRQAFNLAVDRDRLVTTIWRGNGVAATGPLPPGMPGYVARSAPYPFDPERARALLAEAGYADGLPPLTYVAAGFSDPGGLETAVITFWQENLGASITVELVEPFAYYDALFAGRVGNLFTGGWCADYPDPENFLDVLYNSASPQNLGGVHLPAVDAQLGAAAATDDVSLRLARYQAIEAAVIEAAVDVPLAHGLTAVLVKPRLLGYVLTPIGVPQWGRVRLAP